MEYKVLQCPNCGATLSIEDGLDTFFCQYCGTKVMFEGQSDAAYEARTRVKQMAHEERMMDKQIEYDKHEADKERRFDKAALLCSIAVILGGILLVGMIAVLHAA